jgi:IclR family transcriptional regulator, acetate operon repressor
MDVLRFLSSRLRPAPTMAIAYACGIPKSSTHHLLNVMLERGWVIYFEADKGWGLGPAAFETGSAYLRSQPLQRVARPILQRLTAATERTSHLAVLHGADVLYLDKELHCDVGRRFITEVGIRLPAHLTSVGRAMLAELTPAQVRALYVRPVLVKRTERGPVTVGKLLEELREVKERGCAVEFGLTTPDVGCAGAAVVSHEGFPTAAVGVSFVRTGDCPSLRSRIAKEVVTAAGELSRAIGVRRRSELSVA